jgi:anaerobic magnesium-protoporphyrin IX monomethyl ester cyclase
VTVEIGHQVVMYLKFTLVNPPTTANLETMSRLGLKAPPLGLAYIAATLEREGVDVTTIDAAVTDMSHQELGEVLQRTHPDVIGVTSTTPTIYDAIKTVMIAKENCPDSVTIMGGSHITFMPMETMLACPHLDVGVIGEGEDTVLDLLKMVEGKKPLSEVDGIVYRKNRDVLRNKPRKLIENLDELPFPARHLLPLDKYTVMGKRTKLGSIITSRGCPFHCIFCSSSEFYGRRFRARSPKNVVDEIEELITKYGIRSIEILDDTFTVDKNRAARIAEEIIQRGLDIYWTCGSRADLITRDLLHLFKKAGCVLFYIGVESGSAKVLKTLKKGINLEQVRTVIKWVKELGMEAIGSFIIGTPGETKEDVMKTINFARNSGIDFAQFTAMTPYPGTEIYEIAKREGLLITDDWSKFTTIKPVMRTNEMSTEEISGLVSLAYRKFYLRGSFILRQLLRGRLKWILLILRNNLGAIRSSEPRRS